MTTTENQHSGKRLGVRKPIHVRGRRTACAHVPRRASVPESSEIQYSRPWEPQTVGMAVDHESGGPSGTSKQGPAESFSQLAAKILDQLSVSAWLPAAALVSILLLLGNLHGAHGSPARALRGIGRMNGRSLILL